MSILGSLIVELKAQTASFIDGMNAAAKTSKTVGREIESSFSSLGSVAATALAPFGQIGVAVAATLEKIGSSAGGAIVNMGKMGGAMGGVAAIGAGAAAAIGAVGLGSIALATHTAESIAKMGELAQSTGVSVEALSGLSFVGKQVGVDTETMAKSLEKMSKAVFAAATAPATAVNAFTRLGISVRGSGGQIRETTAIFEDLAGKFSSMPDGVTKTALAIQIFGRGGAEIIPVLNKGRDGIKEFLDTAQALGVVLDNQTVQAAEKFKESLATIEAAGTGLSYNLTKQLLPALLTVTDSLVNGLKDKSSGLNDVINGVVYLTKAFLAVGETIWAVLKQIGLFVGNSIAYFIELGTGAYNAVARAAHFDWSGTVSAWQDSRTKMKAIDSTLATDSAKIWGDNAKFITGVFGPLPPATARPTGGGTADTKPAKEDTTLLRIQERIKALQQETLDWAKVASAGSQAEALIAEAVKKGNEEFGKLKAEAAKDKTGAALPFVLKNEDVIRSAGAESVFGAAIKSLVGDLDKEKLKLDEQGKAALELAAAYQQGGAAIANAALGQKFAQEGAKLQVLVEAHALAATQWGKDSQIATQLADAVARLTTSLQNNEDTARKVASNELSAELAKQSHQFAALQPYIDAVSSSYLQGEDAVRRARIELELYRFEEDQLAKGIVLTSAQKQQERKILEDADRQSYDDALKQEAAQFSLTAQYDNQIVKLQRLKEVLQENGQSTLLLDAKLQDAEDALIHQWDEAAFKIGSFSEKFKGVMGELVIQGRAAGAAISQAFVSAIDGIETNLAKLLTGQKANFKAVAQGLAEQITKAEIQKGVGGLASQFGIKIPGLSGKPDGTPSNPLHVVISKDGTGILGGNKAGDTAGAGSVIGKVGKLFGLSGSAGSSAGDVPDGTQANPFYILNAASSSATSLGASSGVGSILSSFGGFMADGGDMSPGKWYVAGEKGPEIIGPRNGGSRVSPMSMGNTHNVTQNFHYPNAPARDLFGRTEKQHAAKHQRNLKMAYGF